MYKEGKGCFIKVSQISSLNAEEDRRSYLQIREYTNARTLLKGQLE